LSPSSDNGRGTATIVHAMPGRVRVRLDRSLRSPDTVRFVTETLSGLEGVRELRFNPATGCLLLLYDPDILHIDQLLLAASAANIEVVPPTSPAPPQEGDITPLARSINALFREIDRRLLRLTSGKLDARTLFPVGLGAAALRQIIVSRGEIAAAPWYVLLWYSFEAFTKFNRAPGGRSIDKPER